MPSAVTNATQASFEFTADEAGASFACSLDDAAFAPCTSPASYSGLAEGAHNFKVSATDQAGNTDTTPAIHSWEIVAAIVMAAGDIACKPGATVTATKCHHGATSDLLINEPELRNVLPLGDLQYEDACFSDFMGPGAYHDTWGRKLAISRPVPGNHEYHAPALCELLGGPGYYAYFGSAAGDSTKGYYSFDVGSWHLIALNSEIPSGASSPQVAWLKADLAATTAPCILAYWHKPRFSSGSHGSTTGFLELWNALYGKAELVLNGHDHDYERFKPQDPTGNLDPNGIREFVVGTGGSALVPLRSTIEPNSELQNDTTFGVLKLTLHASSYDWQFVPEAGGTFTDVGSAACH